MTRCAMTRAGRSHCGRELAQGLRAYVEQAPEDLAAATIPALAPPEDFVPPELVGKPVLLVVVA